MLVGADSQEDSECQCVTRRCLTVTASASLPGLLKSFKSKSISVLEITVSPMPLEIFLNQTF